MLNDANMNLSSALETQGARHAVDRKTRLRKQQHALRLKQRLGRLTPINCTNLCLNVHVTQQNHASVSPAGARGPDNPATNSVPLKEQSSWKQVLFNITVAAMPGRLTALMGPSGAGKSTLMDVMSNRLPRGTPVRVSGEVRVGARPVRLGEEGPIGEYVRQADMFVPCMTATETLQLFANLKLPNSLYSSEVVTGRIKQALDTMGLSQSANTNCGGVMPGGLELKGLSGGEKRRLSIACGLLGSPSVILLDEPTSGLDSFNALMVMTSLHRLTTGPGAMTVIATIHQPSAEVWQLLEDVILLSRGRVMYEGRNSRLMPWFVDTLNLACPGVQRHPGEYALALVTTGFEKPRAIFGDMSKVQTDADVRWLNAQLREHGQRARLLWRHALAGALAEVAAQKKPSDGASKPQFRTTQGSGFVGLMQQICALNRRHWINYTRNPGNAAARMVVAVALGVLVGASYWNLELWTDLMGVLWFSMSTLVLMPFCSIALFAADRRFYLSETQDGLYSAFAFWLSWGVAETTLNVITALLFGLPMHFMVDLTFHLDDRIWNLVWMMAVFIALYLVASQLLIALSLIMPNQDMTFAAGAAWIAICQLFGGYMIHIDHLMPTLSWLSWFSYMRFSFSAALLVELKSKGQVYNQHDLAKRALSGPDHADWLKMVLMFLPEQVDGEEIARNYSYWPGTTLGGIGVLMIFLAAFHLTTYLALVYQHGCFRVPRVIHAPSLLHCLPAVCGMSEGATISPQGVGPSLLTIPPFSPPAGRPPTVPEHSELDVEAAQPRIDGVSAKHIRRTHTAPV